MKIETYTYDIAFDLKTIIRKQNIIIIDKEISPIYPKYFTTEFEKSDAILQERLPYIIGVHKNKITIIINDGNDKVINVKLNYFQRMKIRNYWDDGRNLWINRNSNKLAIIISGLGVCVAIMAFVISYLKPSKEQLEILKVQTEKNIKQTNLRIDTLKNRLKNDQKPLNISK